MMHEEFEKITGLEISYRDYSEVIEPMYSALSMDKFRFCEMIKPTAKVMAKKYAEERKAAEMNAQRLVFVSDGTKTPNGAYFVGGFFKLVGCDIKTGKVIVRNLTDEEYSAEVSPYFSSYCHGTYDVHKRNVKIVA